MIVPYSHVQDLDKLTIDESCDLFDTSIKAVGVLKNAMPADGFNIGMNLGAVAGAGIEDHLHMHVVPRFRGDTSFLAVLGNTKVQSLSMDEIYDMLKHGFENLKS